MTRSNRSRARRSGVTIVETAIVISMTLLVLLGIIEYGRLIMTRQLLENAAREGARYAVVNTYEVTTAQVQDFVHDYLGGQQNELTNYNKTTSIQVYLASSTGGPKNTGAWNATANDWKSAQFGDLIAVRITGTYAPVGASLLSMSNSFTLTVTAVMSSEAN